MTYAIISDIHGNHPALIAAIADAKAQGANEYILLGDYASRYPWGNDVVNTIKKLSPAVVVCGNGEGYFNGMKKTNGGKSNEQFKPNQWSYDMLTEENLAYLLALPEKITIHGTSNIYVSHSVDLFWQPGVAHLFHTIHFNNMMLSTPISHDEYLARGREALLSCPNAHASILSLPPGVHLFGHNHLQFHTEYKGRLFINPGSCGMAADWDATAAYTLLTWKDEAWHVAERRVEYDLQTIANGLISTGYHDYAPMWSEVVKQQAQTGKEYFG